MAVIGRVEDMQCFDKVARVIGITGAKCELFKVMNTRHSYWGENSEHFMMKDNLAFAFNWSDTPQGLGFWSDVAKNIVPTEYEDVETD